MKDCNTVEDILNTFDELVYEEETQTILCDLCFVEKEGEGNQAPGQFHVETEEDVLQDDLAEVTMKKRTKPFHNLIKSIKSHFEARLHVENWEAWCAKNDLKQSIIKRNHDVGMRIARICYSEYKEGNSKRHFEQEILKADLNGCDMGDINHSDPLL